VIFRVTDQEGYPVTDFDLILTAGDKSSPNHLPKGFFMDRQKNPNHHNTVTYYFNHSAMTSCPAVLDKNDDNRVVRPALEGTRTLGFQIKPRPTEGFAHYVEGEIKASTQVFDAILKPNATTMVDIVLRRVVGEETCRLDKGIQSHSFKKAKPGKPLED